MVSVKCIVEFKDKEINGYRQVGEEFYVTKERAMELTDTSKPGGALVIVLGTDNEDKKEKVVEEKATPKKKKTASK